MNIGDEVLIRLNGDKRYNSYGIDHKTGTIERVYRSKSPYNTEGDSYGIRIYGISANNGTKLFWLKSRHLDKVSEEIENFEKETNNMGFNINNVMEGYKVCEAYSKEDADIFYGIYYEDVDIPSLAVVQLNGRRELATIVRTDIPREEYEHCRSNLIFEVVGVVDESAFNERQDKLKKRAEIKAKMKERVAKFQEEQFWKMIASEDNEMAKLLEEYSKYGK